MGVHKIVRQYSQKKTINNLKNSLLAFCLTRNIPVLTSYRQVKTKNYSVTKQHKNTKFPSENVLKIEILSTKAFIHGIISFANSTKRLSQAV